MYRSWIPTSPSPCLRFAESLAVSAQDSGPSRSLVFTRKALSSSTSCRFIPAHCNGDVTFQQESKDPPTGGSKSPRSPNCWTVDGTSFDSSRIIKQVEERDSHVCPAPQKESSCFRVYTLGS